MRIAVVLFDRFTALDAVGPYETLSRVPGAETVFVAQRPGPVRNDGGSLALVADRALVDVPEPDVLVVPGGPGQSDQMANEALPGCSRADPRPPYDAGSPRKAPAHLVERFRAAGRFSRRGQPGAST
ncbi:DJ-1/PfpI family protein [Streptomyces longisporoflavus]|uniref:DJ-1/PfpI family protein n=1 Tax=Streptomyces longisporoflavus TaxID=28044 RepID=A0ABW7QUC6_9ACTN